MKDLHSPPIDEYRLSQEHFQQLFSQATEKGLDPHEYVKEYAATGPRIWNFSDPIWKFAGERGRSSSVAKAST